MKNETVQILYEDKDIIVCVKPSGIATQSHKVGTPDVESILRNHLARNEAKPTHDTKKQENVHNARHDSRGNVYLAVIHRLDQPVEGLLVFAKTPAAARALNKQLTTRGFGKHYRAVLEGVPTPSQGTLENYLCRDARSNLSRVCAADTPGAQLARLSYRVTHAEADHGTVEITLDTGRHHQIRVQMSAMGCPIVGDVKYGAKPSNAGRIALCAYRLEFRHPTTNKPLRFELPER